MRIEVSESWNSRSKHLVVGYSDGGEQIGLLGVVYLPRGRKWATVMENGHQAFKDVVGAAIGVSAGADMLKSRFESGLSPYQGMEH